MTWIDEVFEQHKLVFIQRFNTDRFDFPNCPSCDHCEVSRAVGLWQDWEGKAHALCSKCNVGAEPMIEGVSYRPTQYPKVQPVQIPVNRVQDSGQGT